MYAQAAFAAFNRRRRSGTWRSIPNCSLWVTPAERKPVVRAGVQAWSRPTTYVPPRGSPLEPTRLVARAVHRSRPVRAIHSRGARPVMSAGVTVTPRRPLSGSVRIRHFDPRRLIDNGSVRSQSTTTWNSEAAYRLTFRAQPVAEVFNIFDANVSEIDYFYTSRLLGEPTIGVDDVHTHPVLPRSVRVGRQLSF